MSGLKAKGFKVNRKGGKGKGKKVVDQPHSSSPKPTPVQYTPPTRYERRLTVKEFGNALCLCLFTHLLLFLLSAWLLVTTRISSKPRHYLITVRTGDRAYSTNAAPIFISLLGSLGVSPEFQLLRPFVTAHSHKFEKGSVHFLTIRDNSHL